MSPKLSNARGNYTHITSPVECGWVILLHFNRKAVHTPSWFCMRGCQTSLWHCHCITRNLNCINGKEIESIWTKCSLGSVIHFKPWRLKQWLLHRTLRISFLILKMFPGWVKVHGGWANLRQADCEGEKKLDFQRNKVFVRVANRQGDSA